MMRGIAIIASLALAGIACAGEVFDTNEAGSAALLTEEFRYSGPPPSLQENRVKSKDVPTLRGIKMGGAIRDLLRTWELHKFEGTERGITKTTLKNTFRPGNPFVQVQTSGAVQIYVAVNSLDKNVLNSLEQLGLIIELHNDNLKKIQGWIDIELLDALSESPEVVSITAPVYGRPQSGSTVSEGDDILNSDELRVLGYSGAGIRVGVISDGANDWLDAHASGDLPAGGITTYGTCTKRAFNPVECEFELTCNEGTAMAEIIHDLAPEAELAVGAGLSSLEFIQRIDDLVNDFGAHIIVDDIGFYGAPYFEDGDVADAVAAAATSVLFVSSAGNSADGHYEKTYKKLKGATWHDFGKAEGGAIDPDQGVIIPPDDYIWVILQWNDPFSSPSSDYDLYLLDNTGVAASSIDDQSLEGASAIEGFCYYNPTDESQLRWIIVDKFSGAAGILKIFTLGDWGTQYSHPNGSIIGHSAVSETVTVGAIYADDDGHNNITYYSSRGPSNIYFPSFESRAKPDITGIHGVSVTGSGGFYNPFYGTSASAPHVAAIAAQLMSVSPTVSPEHIRNALAEGARDLGSAGFDYDSGFGIADALQSFAMLELLANSEDTDGDRIADQWERNNVPTGIDPNSAKALDIFHNRRDFDRDGFSDLWEYLNDSDPLAMNVAGGPGYNQASDIRVDSGKFPLDLLTPPLTTK